MASILRAPVPAAALTGDRVAATNVVTQSPTLRQYRATLLWTFAAIGVCVLGYALEKFVAGGALGWITDVRYRLFKNPAELPMRIFGLPHFLIGLAFMLSSRRMRGLRSVMWLAGLAALGAGLCWLFHRYGRIVRPDGDVSFDALALLLFYFYFLIHGFRDEAYFYRSFGEMPADAGPTHARIMVVLQALMLGLLIALAIPAYVLYGQIKPEFRHPVLESLFPADWPYALRFAASFGPMVMIAAAALWCIGRAVPGGLAGLWRVHRPILTVFLGSTGIILLALVSGPWSFNVVVLMHFVSWYLFARHMLRQRPPPREPAGLWAWLRTTVPGFTWLHLGLAAVVVVLVVLATYGFGKSGPLEAIVGSKAFYYWTIMHVTLSFYPRN
jgi:hypothetical protein